MVALVRILVFMKWQLYTAMTSDTSTSFNKESFSSSNIKIQLWRFLKKLRSFKMNSCIPYPRQHFLINLLIVSFLSNLFIWEKILDFFGSNGLRLDADFRLQLNKSWPPSCQRKFLPPRFSSRTSSLAGSSSEGWLDETNTWLCNFRRSL